MNFSLTDVECIKLANGLKVLVRPDRSIPIVTTMLWYQVGSRSEEPGSTGVSHFLEHMMFKGTKRLAKGAIDQLTTWNGGFNNAFTGRDYTVYYFSFASDRWWSALEIEADRMVNALLDPEEFELEKQVILEEMRMAMDDPWESMRQTVDFRAFGDHPYRNPIIGQLDDVSDLTLDTLIKHYDRYYVPNNATLVIVGDVDVDEALKRIDKTLGSLPSTPIVNPGRRLQPERRPERIEIANPSAVTRVLVAIPAPAIDNSQLSNMQLIDRILSEGKLSRLHLRMVENEQLASLATSDIEETMDPYHVFIRLELEKGVKPELAVRCVLDELKKLCEEEPDEAELRKAKNQCVSQFLNDLETTFDQSFQLGLWETLSHWEGLNEYIEGLESVSASQLCQTAAKYCDPEKAVVCVAVPDSN